MSNKLKSIKPFIGLVIDDSSKPLGELWRRARFNTECKQHKCQHPAQCAADGEQAYQDKLAWARSQSEERLEGADIFTVIGASITPTLITDRLIAMNCAIDHLHNNHDLECENNEETITAIKILTARKMAYRATLRTMIEDNGLTEYEKGKIMAMLFREIEAKEEAIERMFEERGRCVKAASRPGKDVNSVR